MHSKVIAEEYFCDHCNRKFYSFWECKRHEKEKHVCNKCKHSYLVYNSELECALKNKGEECNFEPRKGSK